LELFQASPESESEAGIYFHIRIWSAPAALANYCLLGWFIGVQNMRAALILQVLMNGINIALDLLFVVGLGMETAGVAAATAIAEVMAVAAGLVLVLKELTHMRGRLTRSAIFDRARIMRMLTLNRDIFIRTFLLIFAFVLFTAEGAKFGDGTLAANAVLLQFQFFLAFGLDGFAHSAEALVGNALGAGDRKELAAWVRVTGLWALVVALLYVIFYLLAGNLIIDLLTGLEGVREEARQFLPWVIASPFLSVWSYMLDGIFIGATRSREMRNAMIASVAIYGASLYLAQPVLGNHGLWLSLMVLMLARAATLLAYYPRISREI
jgi:MATE family multidrug resistance protein